MRRHPGVVLGRFMKAHVEMVTRMVGSKFVCVLGSIVCFQCKEFALLEVVN